MSIFCKFCHYEITTFEFIGYMTAEVLLILKEKIKTRKPNQDWNHFMTGFANNLKIPCANCQKSDWLPVLEQNLFIEKKQKKELHVK